MKTPYLISIIVIPLAIILSFSLVPFTGHASFEEGPRTSWVEGHDIGEIQLPKSQCTQNQKFGPGPHLHSTGGPMHWPWPSSDNVVGSGFSETLQANDGGQEINDYVLEPGHSAQISYSLYVKSNGFALRNIVWVSNDAGFLHRSNDTIVHRKISDMGNWTFSNGTTKHMWGVTTVVQDTTGGGYEYGPRPSDTISLPTIVFDHPGISVSYWPPIELVGVVPVTVTASVAASQDAPEGTYWMYLAPGPNDGGPEVLLTVGRCSD
ncbi:MAG: hypothetical protein ACREBI_07865 [Nitrosotalea sp.]